MLCMQCQFENPSDACFCEQCGRRLEYGHAYRILGEVYASDEYRDFDRAAWHLEESLKAARAVGAQLDVARYLSGARISLIKGDHVARELAEKARQIADACGARPVVEEAEEILTSAAQEEEQRR